MMANRWHLLRFFLPVLVFFSCDIFQSEEEETLDPGEEIRQLTQQFVNEAAVRGFDFSRAVDSLEIELTDNIVLDGQSYCGLTSWYGEQAANDNQVTIAINDNCWFSREKEDHEVLVFHELGHAILNRGHRDDLLPNRNRASIMVGGNLAGLYVGNAKFKREYYIDELFDPNTPPPDWSQ